MDSALGKRTIAVPPPSYHLIGKFGLTYNRTGLCCSTFVGHTISPSERHTLCTLDTEIGSKQRGCGKFPFVLQEVFTHLTNIVQTVVLVTITKGF